MIVTHVDQLDAEDRETVFAMTLCAPIAGESARVFLREFVEYRGTAVEAFDELFAWLYLARDACGLEACGHA